MLLVASSYVTWTYQTHTFSNSIETLVVAWSLVLIERIVASQVGGQQGTIVHGVCANKTQQRGSVLASSVLGIVAIFGLFNRITFPAFLLIPGIRLLPHYWKK
jgi:phosphatidylinositol glycan class Z